jgi:hypothetical protein
MTEDRHSHVQYVDVPRRASFRASTRGYCSQIGSSSLENSMQRLERGAQQAFVRRERAGRDAPCHFHEQGARANASRPGRVQVSTPPPRQRNRHLADPSARPHAPRCCRPFTTATPAIAPRAAGAHQWSLKPQRARPGPGWLDREQHRRGRRQKTSAGVMRPSRR